MEHYPLIKHLHMTVAGISLAFFLVRAWGSVCASSWLARRWIRGLPHLIDTVLLGLGVWMMVGLSLWPHQQSWLAAKLIGLMVYIGLGSLAIKRGRTPTTRMLAACAAVIAFAYVVGAAIQHSPWSWLA